MILDMLKEENVQIVERVDNWKEAITVSLQSLLDQGYVTEEYGKSIIQITEEMGPYYVLTENVCINPWKTRIRSAEETAGSNRSQKSNQVFRRRQSGSFAGSVSGYGLRISFISDADSCRVVYERRCDRRPCKCPGCKTGI